MKKIIMAALLSICLVSLFAAGAVDDDFAMTEVSLDRIGSRLDGLGAGNIASDRKNIDTVLFFPFSSAGFKSLDSSCHKNEVGTLLSVTFCHLLAKA